MDKITGDDLVAKLRADADRWMTGDMGRDNEEAGWLAHCAVEEIERLRSAAGDVRTYRHKVRGSTYAEVGRGSLQSAEPIQEGAELVAYRGEDGKMWFRPTAEFDDGRFELVAALATSGKEG